MSDIVPDGYHPLLNLRDTQIAIKAICDYFETNLARELRLTGVQAPIAALCESGLGVSGNLLCNANDGGQGLVPFDSLAKWCRHALREYGFECDEGIYAEHNAICCDVTPDRTHSVFVSSWEWEKVIEKEDVAASTVRQAVKKVFSVFKMTEKYVGSLFPHIEAQLPDEVTFASAQKLEELYPDLAPMQRRYEFVKKHKAAFILQADDCGEDDARELGGDLFFYDGVLDAPLGVMSAGIGVTEETLRDRLKAENEDDKANVPFYRDVLSGRLPNTVGGSINRGRCCMFLLRKAHIGEVQASVWHEDVVEEYRENGIILL